MCDRSAVRCVKNMGRLEQGKKAVQFGLVTYNLTSTHLMFPLSGGIGSWLPAALPAAKSKGVIKIHHAPANLP